MNIASFFKKIISKEKPVVVELESEPQPPPDSLVVAWSEDVQKVFHQHQDMLACRNALALHLLQAELAKDELMASYGDAMKEEQKLIRELQTKSGLPLTVKYAVELPSKMGDKLTFKLAE